MLPLFAALLSAVVSGLLINSFLVERRLAREYREDMQARMDEYKSVVFE